MGKSSRAEIIDFDIKPFQLLTLTFYHQVTDYQNLAQVQEPLYKKLRSEFIVGYNC